MLLLCMFPNNHLYLGSYDLVQENTQKTYLQICPAKLLPHMLNPSASSSITHWFESKRTLVPGLKAFTLDVTQSPHCQYLCACLIISSTLERGTCSAVWGQCSDSAVPPTPLRLLVILFHIVNKRIRKIKHN